MSESWDERDEREARELMEEAMMEATIRMVIREDHDYRVSQCKSLVATDECPPRGCYDCPYRRM